MTEVVLRPGFAAATHVARRIEVGMRADALAHRHAVTPYAGIALRGVVRQTWLAGRIVFDHEQVRQPA